MDKTAIRVVQKVWKKKEAKDGRTFYYPVSAVNVADTVRAPMCNPADEIHVDHHDPQSRGYGGSVLKFELEDGTIDEVKGPWHGGYNSEEVTGVRVSDLHYSHVTIGFKAGEGFMEVEPSSIVYQDPGWVLGPYMRGARIAQQLADLWDTTLYCVSHSYGGASAGYHNPGDKQHIMARRPTDER